MAASDSPIPGLSPAAKPSCWKAACAYRRSSPGRRAFRAARTTDQVAISMDWMPTLLAAAGAAPDPAFPPDGINLLPMLTGNAAAVERKLFWRYKANAQRAARDGDFKFLKILDNTFLFNVVDDPMERANLKVAPPGYLRPPRGGMGRLERHHAAGNRRKLHQQLHRRATSRPYRDAQNKHKSGQSHAANRAIGKTSLTSGSPADSETIDAGEGNESTVDLRP